MNRMARMDRIYRMTRMAWMAGRGPVAKTMDMQQIENSFMWNEAGQQGGCADHVPVPGFLGIKTP